MPYSFLQDLTFETEGCAELERMLEVAIDLFGCTHLFRLTGGRADFYPSLAAAYLMSFLGRPPRDLARWLPPDQRPEGYYQPVCRIAARPNSWGLEEPIPVTDRADLLRRASEIVRAADLDTFRRETGEGPFVGCDGLVVPGYRLHGGSSEERGTLVVSLCLIYLPK